MPNTKAQKTILAMIFMRVPYRAKTIALFFLELGEKDRIPISPMKLQKLIYFAHGWCLAITGQPLIEESIEAWRYGPVISNIYYWFRKFGANPIQLDEIDTDVEDWQRLAKMKRDQETVELLTRVWDVYKGYDALELSEMTHLPTSPWELAREKISDLKFNVTIDDEQIKKYFIQHSAKTHANHA
jgi:uncharacterized phage-associated protein